MKELGQESKQPLFSRKALMALLLPLIVERLLDMTVGMADTVMVASYGEAAISGVALIDSINNLVLFIVAAQATGGAVVIAQFLGRENIPDARNAAKHLLYVTTATAFVLMLVLLLLRDSIIALLFGALEPALLENTRTYCWITALSFPFIAISNSIAALYRSTGNSKVTMLISLMMNAINIGGNAFLIYGCKMGVAGAAIASLVSRILSAAAFVWIVRNHRNLIYLDKLLTIKFRPDLIKSILKVGIPSGLENGMFHLGKLMVQSLITTFGTAVIAANAAATQIANVTFVPGSAISLGIITVVGQCIGAGDYAQAAGYTKKLMKYIYIIQGAMCVLIFALAPQAARLFNLSSGAMTLAVQVIRIHMLFLATVWPVSFPFANVLRAAGDARFTMAVSVASMWIFRIGLSYALSAMFQLGLMSVYYAMFADLLLRAGIWLWRYRSGKWRSIQIIQ